jgi:hypothetical protein
MGANKVFTDVFGVRITATSSKKTGQRIHGTGLQGITKYVGLVL